MKKAKRSKINDHMNTQEHAMQSVTRAMVVQLCLHIGAEKYCKRSVGCNGPLN